MTDATRQEAILGPVCFYIAVETLKFYHAHLSVPKPIYNVSHPFGLPQSVSMPSLSLSVFFLLT